MTLNAFAASTRLPRLLAVASIGATSTLAVILLGLAGVVASLLFLPVMLSLAMDRTNTSRRPELPSLLSGRDFITTALNKFLGQIGHPTVALLVEIDSFQELEDLHDQDTLDRILAHTQRMIETHLTEADVVTHLNGSCFAAALAPQAPHNLEAMLNTCTRIQQSLDDPDLFTGLSSSIKASIGFAASSKLSAPTGPQLLQAAKEALTEARRRGPGAVRSFSKAMSSKRNTFKKVGKEAIDAFEKGQISSYFQPQISLRDGSLSGFEALTRWHHPTRGMMSPAEFLPILEQAGLMRDLGDTMLRHALQALVHWDSAGIEVPRIGVNFSTNELRDPLLVDRIAMLLDAGGLEPSRLVIEVLETVIAQDSNDDIVCNLAALSDLGCGIDLDDFGTGYASITNIRRFSVERIKVDRTFVAGLDDDDEQRSMVSAILTMANRLGVTTLAEGVETKAELAALAELGCHDAQGFTIARPMPLEETTGWVLSHIGPQSEPIPLSQRVG